MATSVPIRYLRPPTLHRVTGMAWVADRLLLLDGPTGRLAWFAPAAEDLVICNDGRSGEFRRATGLAWAAGSLWWVQQGRVLRAAVSEPDDPGLPWLGAAHTFAEVPGAVAVAVLPSPLTVVVLSGRGDLTFFDAAGRPTETGLVAGIGPKNITADADGLWVCDDAEQTVYRLDRAGRELFRAVTPLEHPTAIAVRPGDPAPHLAYYEDEPYLKDNPWIEPCWEVRYHDRTLIHQLHFAVDPSRRCAWSTGYRLEMTYLVEVDPDEDGVWPRAQWRLALPIDTPRQRVEQVHAVGHPFTIEEIEGERRAVFDLGDLTGQSRLLLGWQATFEVFGIKHQLGPDSPARLAAASTELDPLLAATYLIDDDDLAMHTSRMRRAVDAARAHAGPAADPVTLAHAIRNYVYDQVDYEMGHSDSPDVVLERGTGSCGEYVGVLLGMTRLAGLATRTAGRYKCPYQPWASHPLHPDFNHVWLDLHLPGYGWIPVESNPDDTDDGGPYPDRFFGGLPWRHIELAKEISFERVTYLAADGRRRQASARGLSRNHIAFRVLAELAPTALE
ncbi:MAG: transglutaminase domain-containing protein [Candidatus Nanopelagicales bacterium]